MVNLDAPISLGLVSIGDGMTFQINKTNPIKLNRYWEDLVKIWIDKDFFEYEAKKYLNKDLVMSLFKVEDTEFPIQINISIGEWTPEEENTKDLTTQQKLQLAKDKSLKKTNKLYVATKFKDAFFGEKDEEVNDFFLKSIDTLEENPNLITKFNKFVKFIQNPPKLDKWWGYD